MVGKGEITMAYFANGTIGMRYEEIYCDKCVHNLEDFCCPCLTAHMLWNYEEANKKGSVLHKMIPMSEDGLYPQKCIFFVGK